MTVHAHLFYTYFASTPTWEVGGVSCTRKVVPVGEGRAKVVTPLTDIQLLHPVTAIMLRKGTGGDERKEKGRQEIKRKGKNGGKRNRQEGENYVDDCKVKQGEREGGRQREAKGKEEEDRKRQG